MSEELCEQESLCRFENIIPRNPNDWFGDVVLYNAYVQVFFNVAFGTGDNLDADDINNGYDDYIMVEMYKLDGTDVEEIDGGQIMLTKLVADMTHEEFKQAVLDFWGIDKERAKEL